jgi:hypothetical protein
MRHACNILVRKLRLSISRWEKDIKMDLKEIRLKVVDRILPASG